MEILKDGGKVGELVTLTAAHPGRQEKEQRPDPLAAVEQDMTPYLGDQRDMGLEIGH